MANVTPVQNFTVIDIARMAEAATIFALVFLPPGFVVAWCSNVLGFRQRSTEEKLLFSVVLSIAIVPILTVLLGRYTANAVVSCVFLLLILSAALILIRAGLSRESRPFSSVSRSTWFGLGIMALWSIAACVSVVDLQLGDRLYPSAVIFDHSVRIPLVESAARTGVPPVNPFFGMGKAPVLRYYYYWSVVCALPERLLGLSARACFHASVLWSGFALAALIPLYLEHFLGERKSLRRKSLIGISLLAVTGLDLIPYGLKYFQQHVLLADLEWWNPNQITSWFDSLVWVPHHIVALTACMTGLLVLSTLDGTATTRERVWAVAIAGLAFASTAGLSVYVAFVFTVFAVLWTILLLAQRRILDSATYAAAGGLALILSLPYLFDLQSKSSLSDPQSNSIAGLKFAVLAVRDFPGGVEWLHQLGLHGLALDIARIPLIVLVYFVELGFFLCIGVLQFKRELLNREPLTQPRRQAWVLMASSLLIISTLQSDPRASGGNDLGFRGALLVQFILLLWAAPLLHDAFFEPGSTPRLARAWKGVLACTLIVGVLGTVCQFVMLRSYAYLVDSGQIERSEGYFGEPSELGRRIYLLRNGFTDIDRATPALSVMQYNPVSMNLELMHLYSTRQVAAGDESCSSSFGGDPEKCGKAMPYMVTVFNYPENIRDWNIDRFCNTFSINLLVATEADPVWRDADSWVWNRKPVVANDLLRAIPCGTAIPR